MCRASSGDINVVCVDVCASRTVHLCYNNAARERIVIEHAELCDTAAGCVLNVQASTFFDNEVSRSVHFHSASQRLCGVGGRNVDVVTRYICACGVVYFIDDNTAREVATVKHAELSKDTLFRALNVHSTSAINYKLPVCVNVHFASQRVDGGRAGNINMVGGDIGRAFVTPRLSCFVDSEGDFSGLDIVPAVSCPDNHTYHAVGLLKLGKRFAQFGFGLRLASTATAASAASCVLGGLTVYVDDVRNIVANVGQVP